MLDAGVDGVIVPQVNSVAEAQAAVQWTKYRPLGQRGVGIGRAQGFGKNFADYIARANDEVLTIVQIEHIDAVNALEGIVKVEGIDGVFVGPYDLSDSMGLRGQIDHPQVQGAIAATARICAAKNMLSGIFTGNAAAAKARIAEGFRLIAMGTDGLLLSGAAGEALKTAKN
ncbi:MAG: aldolase/citrate lyase family protein [Alphaproteobacteria bacterium]